MANDKHIFIGIGGQGVKTVSKIKAKVYEKRFPNRTATRSRLQAMNDSYRFLFIDTDQRDIDNANKENRISFEQGNVPFINPQTDLINLGRANPQAIYYEAKESPDTLINKRILEACSPELASKIPDQPLSFGAGAFRIKSRIAFAHSLADFQAKLQSAISSLNDVHTIGGEDCVIYYWLVSSSLGGTGSGIVNDVLYHINQLHHQIVGNGDPQLVFTLYMPKAFIDANATEEKYPLNAFGVFSELEAFKKMSYNDNQNTVMHRLAFNSDYNLVDVNKRYCPFYYVIPVDIQTDKGTSLGSMHTMILNTAEMLYHLHNGQAGATFRSDIDNYMNDIMEKNHENFLVPMGYVSLQKPVEQFNKYMRARLRRDLLRSWLLCNSKKQAKVEKEDIKPIVEKIFRELDPFITGTIASEVMRQGLVIKNKVEDIDDSQKTLDDDYKFDNILSDLRGVDISFADESTDEKIKQYKKVIEDQLWQYAEQLIREHGLAYAFNALNEARRMAARECQDFDETIKREEAELKEQEEELNKLSDETRVDFWEKTGIKNNSDDISAYRSALISYVEKRLLMLTRKWANLIKRQFCMDERNDVLSMVTRHLNGMISKAEDLNNQAVREYKKLALQFGDAGLDVTTVYLPMLSRICDGNGWITGNFFSKQYTKLIAADEDADETPSRKDITDFLSMNIYNTPNLEDLDSHYKVKMEVRQNDDDEDAGEVKTYMDVRFFANPVLVEQGNTSNEKIINDFLKIATSIFEDKLHTNKDIQENWDNRKIYSFFSDLTNEEKDEVRRSLHPSLFFSYNNSRIEVTKKEEHVIFVASTEDMAEEMLGYQKGNTKQRFEKNDDENSALILKSKFGLSLKDYRIYDSIKTVYDNATFRQKYHFHRDFAQHLSELTIDKLPLEVLPQHHTFVKLLMLNELRPELSVLFYKDEYDDDLYTDTLMYKDYEKSIHIALPDALITDGKRTDGKLALIKEKDGRRLYHEIEGETFVDRFRKYSDLYHNERYGETTDRLIQAILRIQVAVKDAATDALVTVRGETILKENYDAKCHQLLTALNKSKKEATTVEEKKLYSVLFDILRNNYSSVNDFKH